MKKVSHTTNLCAICNKMDRDKILYQKNFDSKKHLNKRIFSARRLPDKIHGSIVRCERCGLVRSLELIDSNQLKELYTESDFTYSFMTSKLRDSYSLIIKQASRYVTSKNSFLEIGCGNGFMLEEAKLLGYKNVTGVEPSKDAILHADKSIRKNIVNGMLKSNSFKPLRFDLICAFQVFDHIPDPNSFLNILHRLLKPGGILVLMNHDVKSLSARILGERSPIFDIEHTYLYDQSTINRILVKNDFKIKEIYSPPAIMTIRYVLRLLPISIKLKKYLSNARISLLDRTIKFKPGNLCAIAIKN